MFTQNPDFILNNQAYGEVGQQLAHINYDSGFCRPYVDNRGNVLLTVNSGKYKIDDNTGDMFPIKMQIRAAEAITKGLMPLSLNQTTMRKDDWIRLDRAIIKAARPRLRAWADARAANTLSIPGMSNSIFEFERVSDSGEAHVDMFDLSEGNSDQPLFQLDAVPLPITHSSFDFSEREIQISRAKGMPISTTMGEMAARRVADTIEKTIIGTTTGMTYANNSAYDNNSTVYGYTNHPDRITKTDLTSNTTADPDVIVTEVLAMIDLATAQNFFGPYMLYTTNDWDQYLNRDYVVGDPADGVATSTSTIRERLRKIDDIQDVRRLDFWTDTSALLLVQMMPETIRAISGMEITTVRWETVGTMKKNFRVMAIQVPNIRSQFIGTDQTNAGAKTGIVHATTA